MTKKAIVKALRKDSRFAVRDTDSGWLIVCVDPAFVPRVPGVFTVGTHKSHGDNQGVVRMFLGDLKRNFNWIPA